MDGFGAALTDATAQLFAQLKSANIDAYNSAMDNLFNLRTGLNILRVPIGSTDFSPDSLQYTMADNEGTQASVNDTEGPLSNFNMNGANTYIIPFLKDALTRNSALKINILPWSPPAWMKTSNSVNSGSLKPGTTNLLTEYLVKSVQGFKDALGVTPWSLSVQNEPSNPTAYPSMLMNNDYEVVMLATLRGRLAQQGLGSVQLWGHEDNFIGWSDAAALVNYNASSLDGLSWHCYNGSSSLLTNYQDALTANNSSDVKGLHLSECSGQSANGAPSSTSLQWWMDNVFNLPSLGMSSITVWNLALNNDNGPHLSRAYCTSCVGAVEVDNNKVTNNLQKLLLSHHSVASSDLTRFGGKPASKIDSTVSGDKNNCLTSTLAFSAVWDQANSQRIGLVVQNVCSKTLSTTISISNQQYFDANIGPGVTTLVVSI
jgi:O-glycosyl hydrolase